MKAPKKAVKPIVRETKIKIVKPLEVGTIKSGPFIKEKVEFPIHMITKIIIPADHVRCIVLKDHQGMFDFHKAGDIVDLPDRRYKTDSFRGLVKKYDGEGQPNKRR